MEIKDDKVKQLELFKDVEEQVREIRVMIDKEGRMLKRQLKPIPSISQRIIQWILNVFGIIYVLIERNVEYPDDDIILGMEIDEDLQKMSRKQLCRYMDAVLPERGFFDIQSTSKIRLGCQLLREYKQLKKLNK
jgi:hypothetical protein|tara:strand:+ start:1094 stop:1495 length:402 start_codon:yes stop_codon:yes gene_type:complete